MLKNIMLIHAMLGMLHSSNGVLLKSSHMFFSVLVYVVRKTLQIDQYNKVHCYQNTRYCGRGWTKSH